MRFILVLAGMGLAGPACAADIGLPAFSYAGVSAISESRSATIPAVKASVAMQPLGVLAQRITQGYLLAQARQKNLMVFSNNPAEHAAFVGMWSRVLEGAGIKVGAATFEDGMSLLNYDAGAPLVIRDFLAEHFQFANPRDDAERTANMEMVAAALRREGMRPVAGFIVDLPYLTPGYGLYYLTSYDENPAHEKAVRILKDDGPIDCGILEKAGAKVLQRYEDFFVVYIGREIGVLHRSADSIAALQVKIEDLKKYLAENNMTFIESSVQELPPGSWRKYAADIYIYR